MNELQIFSNEQFGDVRVVERNGEPWFVGKDVCFAFGDTNYRRSLARLDSDEKGVSQIDTLGGSQEMTVINESGLYSLLFYMQPQKAKGVSQNDLDVEERINKLKKFKRWVTSEVLPSIRKHGLYAVDEVLADPDILISALLELKEERKRAKELEDTVAVQNQQITEMRPKASYYDVVLNCKDLVSISVIAKDYGWSAKRMNDYLHEKGVQYRQGKIWLLYQKYAERGYTNTKTHSYPGSDGDLHTSVHTYWTQAGRLFIYGLLKEDGIFPVMEGAA